MLKYLALLISFQPFGQTGQPTIPNYQSFGIHNKEAVWAQVYHFDASAEETSAKLFEQLKHKAWINNIQYDETDIVADLVNFHPDYKRYGGKFSNTSMIIRTGRWAAKIRIGFKEGKYRVVVFNITYEALQSSTGPGKGTIETHPVTGTLGKLVLNDQRSSFKKNHLRNLDILHYNLKDSFVPAPEPVMSSVDW
jgi:hypothetical protein